ANSEFFRQFLKIPQRNSSATPEKHDWKRFFRSVRLEITEKELAQTAILHAEQRNCWGAPPPLSSGTWTATDFARSIILSI
ncbi:hypothetical protein, partial [Bradyrhizobium sp.]|uniref:hypothetical protein n=1 Tax=Bradyrhizobium sp. TaxID=376 RepID=UPI003C7C7624